ncbi:MAG: LptE family protein [Thermodesulfobacteriota bacterium]
MKNYRPTLLLLLIVSLVISACGYYNPYVYSGPDKKLYITTWKNRTNELNLDSDLHQSLRRWFQKSNAIEVVSKKEGADLILAGEIVSIDLPSLSYGAGNNATEVKVHLNVRYIVKDLGADKVLLENNNHTWTEEYQVGSDSTQTADNEAAAIEIIIDDLSERIYLNTLSQLAKKQ